MSEETFTIASVEDLMARKDFKSLVEKCKSNGKFVKEFQKMKWLNQIHHVGDSLVIERTTLTNKKIRQIVKLLAVYSIYGFEDDQQFPLVEVQFYCGKEELHQQMRERYGDCLSDCEVFLTPETDILFVEVVQKKCSVVPYDEYEGLERGANIYYTRGQYNKQTMQIEPPIETWPKACICNKPLNPDKPYIFCDICKEWYHMECMKISQQEADEQDEYTCLRCQKIQVE